jgi:hypothetical protein
MKIEGPRSFKEKTLTLFLSTSVLILPLFALTQKVEQKGQADSKGKMLHCEYTLSESALAEIDFARTLMLVPPSCYSINLQTLSCLFIYFCMNSHPMSAERRVESMIVRVFRDRTCIHPASKKWR